VTERTEVFKGEHPDECARLAVVTFNAEPWNDDWAFDTGYWEPDDRREVSFLRTLCVRPDVQRTGVGSNLVGHLGKSGVNTIYLITRKGIPAERFYRKHGYKINDEDIVMTHEW
jgi:aminoglycoside 6'-N-acetyltransferase I